MANKVKLIYQCFPGCITFASTYFNSKQTLRALRDSF